MSQTHHSVVITIGEDRFAARLQYDKAPKSCAILEKLMPYRGRLIHARWSGESLWAPLAAVWPPDLLLPPENATGAPALGQVLLFGGGSSEPELLIPYGSCRFASIAGPLAGNPVLIIEDGLTRLVELGSEILWRGAVDLRIENLGNQSNTALPKIGEAGHADQ